MLFEARSSIFIANFEQVPKVIVVDFEHAFHQQGFHFWFLLT